MTVLDRAALKAQLLREYEALLEERLPEGPLTLEEIETVVEELGRLQDSRLEDLLIQEQTPTPDNQVACPQCQGAAPFKRLLSLDVLTMHGNRRLQRRYHRCAHCGHGFAPLDLRLRLDGRNATRQVRAWQAKYGSLDAFATVPALLRDLRGLVLSESTVARTTLEVGAALLAAEATGEVVLAAADATPRPRRPSPGVDRLYLEMDGVYCPLREAWKKDGSLGKLRRRYGECKVGMVFQTQRNAEGLDEGVRWRAYTATLEKIEGFTPRMVALAQAHGSDHARELVVLGDGAEWIRNLCEQHFPRAVQIVDYWHMTQHLYTVANARFGGGTPEAAAWVKDSQWYLDRDMPMAFQLSAGAQEAVGAGAGRESKEG